MARGINSRVKVKTDALLDAVKARRVKMVSDHEKAVETYEAKIGAYQEKVIAALRKATDDAVKGNLPDTGYRNRLDVPCRASAPTKPSLCTRDIDRLIATLEMAADESIIISADDAAHYLG